MNDRITSEPEQEELVQIIGDFLDMGHVENIVAMFKQDKACYAMTGMLIQDERFMVRMGVAVLFEELKTLRPDEIELAVPHLVDQLTSEIPYVRGEATNLLGIIGTQNALEAIAPLRDDPDPQIREIVADILAEANS